MAIVQFVEPGSSQSTENEKAVVRRTLSRLENNLDAALGNPSALASDIQTLIGGEAGKGGISLVAGLQGLRRVIAIVKQGKTVAQTTASRIQQFQNQDAIRSLFIQTSIVEMAEISKGLEYESADEALKIRDEVSELLETEALKTTNDETFTALMKLRAGVSRDITTRAADLSRVESENVPSMTNTLLTAYRLYGEASRDQEITDRNNLAMPGFVSPAENLKVLNA